MKKNITRSVNTLLTRKALRRENMRVVKVLSETVRSMYENQEFNLDVTSRTMDNVVISGTMHFEIDDEALSRSEVAQKYNLTTLMDLHRYIMWNRIDESYVRDTLLAYINNGDVLPMNGAQLVEGLSMLLPIGQALSNDGNHWRMILSLQSREDASEPEEA